MSEEKKTDAKPAQPQPDGRARRGMPGLRSAVIWAEILDKPLALRKRR